MCSSARLPRLLIAAVAVFVALLLPAQTFAPQLAGKPGGSSGLTLTSSYVTLSLNPSAPSWCDNEDDVHDYTWTGSLNGSFSTTSPLCGLSTDYSGGMYWNAGGEGIGVSVTMASSSVLKDLTITAPDGTARHAVLKSTAKGTVTYAACVTPLYFIATDTGSGGLAGGTWTMTLSGTLTKVTFTVDTTMADVSFQKQNCPVSQQNLGPLPAATDLTATTSSSGSVTLNWDSPCAMLGGGGYAIGCYIFRNGVNVATYQNTARTTVNSFTDAGLQPNTVYSYTVQSTDFYLGDTSPQSNVATVTTLS